MNNVMLVTYNLKYLDKINLNNMLNNKFYRYQQFLKPFDKLNLILEPYFPSVVTIVKSPVSATSVLTIFPLFGNHRPETRIIN